MAFGRFLRRVSNFVLPNLGAAGGFANGLIQGQGLGGAVRQGIGSGVQAAAGMLAPGVGAALGIGAPAAGALLGAGSGALNARLGRRDVGTGALIGGGAGYLSAGGNPFGSATTTSSGGGIGLPSFLKDTAVDRIIPSMEDITGIFGSSSTPATESAPISAEENLIQRARQAAGVESASSGGGAIAPGFESFLKNNTGLLSAAGLGAQALMGDRESAAERNLRDSANRARGYANTFIEAGTSGQLPQGLSEGIMQGYEAAKAAIRNKYANLGLAGSTMEVQELNNLERNLASQKFDASMNLANTGFQAAGVADATYRALLQNEINNDNQLMDAIARLSGAGGYSAGVRA